MKGILEGKPEAEAQSILIEAFEGMLHQAAPECFGPECVGLCGVISRSYQHLLGEMGVECVNLQLWREDGPHVVSVVDGICVDWTYRQFDPKADVPRISWISDLLSEGWQVIGHQVWDGGKGDEIVSGRKEAGGNSQ